MKALDIIKQGSFQPCNVTLCLAGDHTQVFHCQSNLRLLPGRRLTALATSNKKKYVVKIYAPHRRSLQEYKEEITGYDLLCSIALDTPTRAYYGADKDKLNIIAYEYAGKARRLSELLQKKPQSSRQWMMLKKFAELAAVLHHNNLLHSDPHLGNFLVKGNTIIMVDVGAIRRVSNQSLCEKNFGLFAAQFPVSWKLERVFSKAYDAGVVTNTRYRERLIDSIRYWRMWRERHYLKKIYRECTAFYVHSALSSKLIINRDYKDRGLIEFLHDADNIFNGKGVVMLKEGNSSTVGVVAINGSEFVIKQYNVKNMGHRIKRAITESRASRSWRNAHRLLLRGFHTARPVAIVEYMKGGLKGVSLFITENVPGISSDRYFHREDITYEEKRIVANRLLLLLNEMHRQRIIHGDVKSSNFIIHKAEPVIVDLDAMRLLGEHANMQKYIDKEMRRFYLNWANEPASEKLFNELRQSD